MRAANEPHWKRCTYQTSLFSSSAVLCCIHFSYAAFSSPILLFKPKHQANNFIFWSETKLNLKFCFNQSINLKIYLLPVITFLQKSELHPTIMEQELSTNPSGLYGESPCYHHHHHHYYFASYGISFVYASSPFSCFFDSASGLFLFVLSFPTVFLELEGMRKPIGNDILEGLFKGRTKNDWKETWSYNLVLVMRHVLSSSCHFGARRSGKRQLVKSVEGTCRSMQICYRIQQQFSSLFRCCEKLTTWYSFIKS